MYMHAPPACTYMYHSAWCPQRPEQGTGRPGTEFLDDCEPPSGFWEANLGPLKE